MISIESKSPKNCHSVCQNPETKTFKYRWSNYGQEVSFPTPKTLRVLRRRPVHLSQSCPRASCTSTSFLGQSSPRASCPSLNPISLSPPFPIQHWTCERAQRERAQGSSQESRQSQSKIPTIAILDPRPSRPEIFDHRSSIHRNPILPRFTESAAERTPSARCNAPNRGCAACKHLHFPLPTSGLCTTSGKCSVLEN